MFIYLSRMGALVKVYDNGEIHYHRIDGSIHKVPHKVSESVDKFKVRALAFQRDLPAWRKISKLPSMKQIEGFAGGVCKNTLGKVCEPDQNSPYTNQVSWLVALGMI